MRILWLSNSPEVPSGYGMQTRIFTPRIRDLGHDVAIHGYFGQQGGVGEWGGMPVFPNYVDQYGQDIVASHAVHWQADILLSLLDIWVCRPETYGPIRWTPWVPVDMQPLAGILGHKAQHAFQVIAMSQFGQRMFHEAGIDAAYIPHGIPSQLYRPLAKQKARDYLGLGKDRFIVGIVAANIARPSRKCLPEMFLAFKLLKEKHSDALLYVHSNMSTAGEYGGVNLPRLCEQLDLKGGRDVLFCDPYPYAAGLFDENHMAAVYSAMDVLCHVSRGEGFGLCYLPGSRVLTETGVKPIEQLTTQDWVVTHHGRLRDVERTMKRLVVDETVVSVQVRGNNQPQMLTLEHPVLAVRRGKHKFQGVRRAVRRGELAPEWIAARELQPGDFLVEPKRQWAPVQRQFIDLGDYATVRGNYLISRYTNRGTGAVTARMVATACGAPLSSARRVLGGYDHTHVCAADRLRIERAADELGWEPLYRPSRLMPLTEDTGFFFGQYLAEGNTGANGQVEFASHVNEGEIRERLARTAKDVWGLPSKELNRGNRGRLVMTCKPLAEALRAACGAGAHRKHLPPFTFDNADFARGLLMGAWLGDGHLGYNPTYTTVSEQLAYGLRMLLSALGFRATIALRPRSRGAFGGSPQWQLGLGGEQTARFLGMFGGADRAKVYRLGAIEMDDAWWVPIEVVGRQRYTGYVYNIEVAEDHSYCVEGLATHNCSLEAQMCGTPVVSGDWTAMSELNFSGWKVPIERAVKEYTPLESFWWVPQPEAIAEQLEAAYLSSDRAERGRRARKAALDYDADRITREYWRPFLQGLAERIGGSVEVSEAAG